MSAEGSAWGCATISSSDLLFPHSNMFVNDFYFPLFFSQKAQNMSVLAFLSGFQDSEMVCLIKLYIASSTTRCFNNLASIMLILESVEDNSNGIDAYAAESALVKKMFRGLSLWVGLFSILKIPRFNIVFQVSFALFLVSDILLRNKVPNTHILFKWLFKNSSFQVAL